MLRSSGSEADRAESQLPISELAAEQRGDRGGLLRCIAPRFSYRHRPPEPLPRLPLEATAGSCRELHTDGGRASRTADSGEAADRIELVARLRTDRLSSERPGMPEPVRGSRSSHFPSSPTIKSQLVSFFENTCLK